MAIDNDFFHNTSVNPCMISNQRFSQRGVRLTAHLPIECLMASYCTRWRHSFKGLSLYGGTGETVFNKDLLNEPTFGRMMQLHCGAEHFGKVIYRGIITRGCS